MRSRSDSEETPGRHGGTLAGRRRTSSEGRRFRRNFLHTGPPKVRRAADHFRKRRQSEIGGRTTVKEFTENLGAGPSTRRKHSTSSIGRTIPKNGWRERQSDYKVKVEGMKEKEVPELNDEFAQRFGEYKTSRNSRPRSVQIWKNINAIMRRKRCARSSFDGSKTTTNSKFPTSLVDRQIQIRVQRLLARSVATGHQSAAAGCGLGENPGGSAAAGDPRRERFIDPRPHGRQGKYRDHRRRGRSGNRKDRGAKRISPRRK